MLAALKMVLEVGMENISRELLRKRNRVVPALQTKGCAVLNADVAEENASAIVSFDLPGKDIAQVHQRLSDANILTSLRVDRSGKKYIRLSPHFYNTDAELDRVIELL
jgi:selenocysteine lyase/cysteine desulfurase